MNPISSAALAAIDINSVMNNGMSVGEKFAFSGQMILMGMGTVFAVLIIIWALLSLLRVFMYDIPNRKKNAAASEIRNEKPASAAVSEPAPVSDEKQMTVSDDTALIAVISAAVSAYRADESQGATYTLPFRVVSYKRKKSGTAWNGAVND